MVKFKKIVVLDPILLLAEHWQMLHEYGEEVIEYSGLDSQQILKKLQREMDQDPKPMCWTQLAQEKIEIDELNKRIKNADCIISCWTSIPDEVLLNNNQIKYIGFWTNNATHRINFELAQEKGLFITIIPDYGTDSVAELTFAGMLAVSRKILISHQNTLRGKWPYELLKTGQYVPIASEIPQKILRNKKLGIVGLGRIGKRVAEIAMAFKMDICYWSKKHHLKYEEMGVKFIELEEMFETCDIISVHLSPFASPGIISKSIISKLKNGAIFINTSAGILVDQKALFDELENNRIHSFLDVYEGLPPRKLLKKLENYGNIFTYRSGWYTQEAITYKGKYLLDNIQKYLMNNKQKAAWEYFNENDELASEIQCSNEKST